MMAAVSHAAAIAVAVAGGVEARAQLVELVVMGRELPNLVLGGLRRAH